MSLVRYARSDPFFNIFDEVFPRQTSSLSTRTGDRRVRVKNFDDHTQISIAAPGLSKKSFHVDLNESVLTVSYTAEEGDDTYFTKDSFTRSWRVTRGTTAEDILASYESGILFVRVEKATGEGTEATNIPVN